MKPQKTVHGEVDSQIMYVDLCVTACAFLCAYLIRQLLLPPQYGLDLKSHLFILPLLMVVLVMTLSYFNGYASPFHTRPSSYAWSIFRAVSVSVGVFLAILFFLHIQYVSRMVIFLFASLELMGLFVVRWVMVSYYKSRVKSGQKKLNVLIVGCKSRAIDLVRALTAQYVWGLRIVGYVDPDPKMVGKIVEGRKVIATVDHIHECLKHNVVDEVIIAISRSLLHDAELIVQACETEGIKVRFMADIFNVQAARISLSDVRGIPLLNMEHVAQDPQQLLAKRLFDLVCTLLALPVLILVFLVVAIAIKLDSPGPVFFVQHRVGMRKHLFPMLKFRSMHVDAEQKLAELEHLNEAEGPIFKMENDPRVTRVGRFIRKTSIDELPQLINVLRGEMSLVGPRPMSQRDVELFDKGIQRKRFSVQPGLTCLWQISGRSNLPFEKWLELDLDYIDRWSFFLDLKILVKTVPAVVFSRGAS